MAKHRRGKRIDKIIHYGFLINCGLASGVIFVLVAEILQGLAAQS